MRMRGKKPIFSYKDTWSLDSILSPIIGEGLIKFKQVLLEKKDHPFMGHPSCLNTIDEWHDILDKMIFAFTVKEPEIEMTTSYTSVPLDRYYDGEQLYEYVNNDPVKAQKEYNEWRVKYDEWNIKVQEGRKLFIEFYDNLWW